MAGRAVVVRGGVSATVGTSPFKSADSGTWTAGAVVETPSSLVTVGDSPVLHQASCVFAFVGKAGQAPVSGASTVTLTATAGGLLADGEGVLLDGDSAQDEYGNTLKAGSSAALRSR
ncbi:hypothetical protein AB0F30_27540 [Streptomyces sp. NPDC029006]|uniref:hypothetical protein n=1 Tax=Streptomyces sp. NPDC029006 TaxID=3155467 RepID=UPI0033EF3BB8